MKEKAEDHPGRVHFEDPGTVKLLFGENDTHLKLNEKSVGVKIHARGNTVSVSGDPIKVQLAEKLLIELYDLVRRGHPLYPNDIVSAVISAAEH